MLVYYSLLYRQKEYVVIKNLVSKKIIFILIAFSLDSNSIQATNNVKNDLCVPSQDIMKNKQIKSLKIKKPIIPWYKKVGNTLQRNKKTVAGVIALIALFTEGGYYWGNRSRKKEDLQLIKGFEQQRQRILQQLDEMKQILQDMEHTHKSLFYLQVEETSRA